VLALLTGCSAVRAPLGPEADDPFRAPEAPSGRTAKAIAFAGRDMVVAAHPLAVEAGVAALADGGSAVDAVIAAQLVLHLVEPQSSGLGGGAFLLHYERAGGRLEAWDGRETAPAAATLDQFLDEQGRPRRFLEAADGGLAVGTPGVLRLLEDVHRAHGRLAWARLFEPAIRLADQGFPISPRLASAIAAAAERLRGEGGPAAELFLDPDGSPRPAGRLLRNPELAQTLRTLAAGGAEAFYRGPLAQRIVDAVRSHPSRPGRLALADLAGYRALRREPLCRVYRLRVRVCGVPAPSSGGIATLQALGLLERFDLAAAGPESLEAVHLVAEAYRLAYADRAAYVADPDFVAVPTAGLLDDGYLRSRSAAIDPARSLGTAVAGRPPGATLALAEDRSERPPSTTHLSVVDRDGNAVAMTSSIENAFGSLRMAGGFLLNNQLTDFSFVPVDAPGRPMANRIEPGKRPRSALAPTLVFALDGELEAVLGSPGGAAIIQYVTKTLIGLVDWRLDVQQAIELPNFGAATSPVTAIEAGTPLEALRPGLEARGHTVVPSGTLVSGLHGIVRNAPRGDGLPPPFARHPGRGLWAGGADPRREGVARGSESVRGSETAPTSEITGGSQTARGSETAGAGD
jgi:gamma-glutamyltranspeptidase/glutathione hydrolase